MLVQLVGAGDLEGPGVEAEVGAASDLDSMVLLVSVVSVVSVVEAQDLLQDLLDLLLDQVVLEV